ncbi:hypothetical protein VTN77DRAFT_5806 [Rasamsonia byssochlamydoides]|uniref:uncharacterized protein n=1 Tax=Rasamsonia byssochlamydoides TaxID=89139 RepID=UPI003742F8CD
MNIPPASRSGLRTCSRCLRQQQTRLAPLYRHTRSLSTTGTLRSATWASSNNPLRASKSSGTSAAKDEQYSQYKRNMVRSAAGIAVCALAMYGVIKLNVFGLPDEKEQQEKQNQVEAQTSNGSVKLDGPPADFPSSPSIIPIKGQDGVEQVETGNSTVPHFPSTIKLPKSIDVSSLQPGQELPVSPEQEEYQLLGLGIRTVSFLSIQVYVVGLYIAKSDIATLQQRLVRTAVQPPTEEAAQSGAVAATSLVSSEREVLKKLLLDPEKGEETWGQILKEGNLRTAIRIVPVRNTDFMHMRDAWVRGMTTRAQRANAKAKELAAAGAPRLSEFEDDTFGQAVNEFKALFGRGTRKNIPKGQVLLLLRDQQGALDALFQSDPKQPLLWLGRVPDERVSRLVWLNYLAGKTVASEPARESIVEGVMGIVERPVGTVVQRVI